MLSFLLVKKDHKHFCIKFCTFVSIPIKHDLANMILAVSENKLLLGPRHTFVANST